ncbi:MAG: hypothetical protein NZ108_10700, partial [Bacteroidia bacterium]|nr:hypothetical protein [Bacteroidia bacterium]
MYPKYNFVTLQTTRIYMLRPYIRLVLVGLVSAISVTMLLLQRAFSSKSKHYQLGKYRKWKWACWVNQVLGLDIEIQGTLPPKNEGLLIFAN